MAESEEQAKEEMVADTPESELLSAEADPGMAEIVITARDLVQVRWERQKLEAAEKKLASVLLPMMEAHEDLHGIRLATGDAVRRSWSVRTTAKPTPEKLREVLADASEFIEEVVNLPALRVSYPSVWEGLGKVKRSQTITVRLKGAD